LKTGKHIIQLNTETKLKAGIYFLKIAGEKTQFTEKIILKGN